MSDFNVKIMKFDGVVFDKDAISVTIPSFDGYLTVMKHHASLIGVLSRGSVGVTVHKNTNDVTHSFDVVCGFYEMSKAGCIIYIDA